MSPRSVKITTAGGLTLLLAVAGAQVWSRSGAAWIWVMLVVLVVVVVADGVSSFVSLRTVRMTATAPRDVQVGRADPIRLEMTKPRGRLLIRSTTTAAAPWVRIDAPQRGDLPVTPDRRGVFSAAEFEVLVSAPLGLVTVSRRFTLMLEHEITVAPREELRLVNPEMVELETQPGFGRDELPRGVREYVVGDALRRVHWPATARRGELMVKDMAAAPRREIEMVVDLGTDEGPAAELIASHAMSALHQLLTAGYRVMLVTFEDEPRRDGVADIVTAGRRLGRARCGPPLVGGALRIDA